MLMTLVVESKPKKVTARVRTSISITPTAQERARAFMRQEGFTSFSDMVEYLIRRSHERQSA